MVESVTLPTLKEVAPGGLSYRSNYLVEFETGSPWYETSLTIAADALRKGIATDYHTFQHPPNRVRVDLANFRLDIKKLERETTFRVMDTYTALAGGLHVPEKTDKTGPGGSFWAQSVKLSDWSIGQVHDIKGNIPPESKKRLHIDDNTGLLGRYNTEDEILDYWRTRIIPWGTAHELAMVHSFVAGVFSETFYKQFETLCDGILDFKSEEQSGKIEHFVRVRMLRGTPYDSRWRHLELLNSGGVTIGSVRAEASQLGVRKWLKGPK